MKIAIDESGDSGRKFWKGSSRWFILAAVIVPDNMQCGPTCQAVDAYRHTSAGGQELHFFSNTHDQHVDFFRYMHDKEYIFASVCIDKRKLIVKRPQILSTKMALLNFAFDKLFIELKPWLDHPVVLVDTSGSEFLNSSLKRHLLKTFGASHKGDINSIEQVRAVDSRNEPLVQLADYVAGAIHHKIDGRYSSRDYEVYLQDKGKIFYV